MIVILSDIKGRVAEVCKMKRNPKIYFDRITIFFILYMVQSIDLSNAPNEHVCTNIKFLL